MEMGVPAAARELGLTEEAIRVRLRNGELRGRRVRVGRRDRWFVDATDVALWRRRREVLGGVELPLAGGDDVPSRPGRHGESFGRDRQTVVAGTLPSGPQERSSPVPHEGVSAVPGVSRPVLPADGAEVGELRGGGAALDLRELSELERLRREVKVLRATLRVLLAADD